MKKLIYLFIGMLAAVSLGVSCSDDDDNGTSFQNTPEVDAAGVYTGTFARVQQGLENPDTLYGEGTMTITADSAYVADITVSCAELGANHTSVANIAHSNGGFAFSNNKSGNGFGEAFIGRIDGDGNAETHFSLRIRSGRNTKTFNFVFKGKKG